MDVLLERTDEEHPISAKDMAQYLRGYGIRVERKTVYDDIEALRIYGLDIRNRRGKVGGFYIANRKFQLPEVKFLMDAVLFQICHTEEIQRTAPQTGEPCYPGSCEETP